MSYDYGRIKNNWMYKKTQLSQESKSENQSAGKSSAHLVDNRPSSVAQRKQNGEASIQKKANNTGLPNNLKSGIENLSGHSMDDVKVHYNSSKPAQLNAHAYAQGTNIHLASGQEKHLPHEAWHVVQQKQGRVKPTMQMKGKVNVNDDIGLEKEADVMGAKAMQLKSRETTSINTPISLSSQVAQLRNNTEITYQSGTLNWATQNNGAHVHNQRVGLHTTAFLDPEDPVRGSRTGGAAGIYGGAGSGNYRVQNSGRNLTQGHLLNANLGGKAQAYNLFPITAEMNRAHSSQVEEVVKSMLLHVKEKRSDEHAEIPAVAAAMAAMPAHTHAAIGAAGGWHAYQNANPMAPNVFGATMAYALRKGATLSALNSEQGRSYTSSEGGVAAGLHGAPVATGSAAATAAAGRAIAAGPGIGQPPIETRANAGQTGVRAAARVNQARMGLLPIFAGAGLPTTAPPNEIAVAARTSGPAAAAGPLQWDNTRVFYDVRVKSNGVNGRPVMKPNNLRNEEFICTAYFTANNSDADRGAGTRVQHTVKAPNNQNAKLAELGFEPHAAPVAGLQISAATAGPAVAGIPTQHNVLNAAGQVVGHATLFQHA